MARHAPLELAEAPGPAPAAPDRRAAVDPAHVPDFDLGALRVRPSLHEVLRDGEPHVLERRVMQVLVALAQAEGEIVARDELIERCWHGKVVGEDALQRCIGRLRRLAESPDGPHFTIESIRAVGYRLRVRGPASAPATPPSPPRRRWALVSGGLAVAAALAIVGAAMWPAPPPPAPAAPLRQAATPHPKSVAVLPFEDLSADGGRQWFADGLTEEVLNSLARTPDLRVASRTSAVQVSRSGADLQEAARRLGVATVLEGSVRRSGGRVRVTAQLIRGSDGFHLWSQNYDRPESDVISIQEDIAFDIARALKTVMEPARLRAMVETGTRSPDAYEAYLRGVALDQRQLAEGDLAFARAAGEAYEEARTLDPQFAAAHWKAARAWFGNATRVDSDVRGEISEAERARRFFERADAAIAGSRDETEKLKYRAFAAAMRLRLREAQRLMARYVRERPRDIDAWEEMADISAWAGEREAVRQAAERVHVLSLQAGEPRSRAITLSVMSLDLEPAVARARAQLALRPDNALTQYQAHRAFLWSGRTGDAAALLERIRRSDLPEEVRALAEMRQACAEGRAADALRWKARVADADLSTRWRAEHILGRPAQAEALLRPWDRADRLPILVQFAIDPTFDASAYPVLSAALVRDGVTLPPPIREPASCAAARAAQRPPG